MIAGRRATPAGSVPRRRLVVHVGTPKTGSTTIQAALAALEPELRQHGVHVPRSGRIGAGSAHHADLPRTLNAFRSNPARGAWPALVDELRRTDARQFVIPSEAFTRPRHPAAVEAIACVADRCALEVHVVGYVRPQCQCFDSTYAQRVANGYERLPFDVFAAVSLFRPSMARHPWLSYRRVFARWRAAFGDRVTVVSLERSRLPDGLTAHFLGLLGAAELAHAAPRGHANARRGAKEIEVRRLTAVALARHRPGAPRKPIMRRLDGVAELLTPDAPFAGLSRAEARSLMDWCEADNAAFAREYGIDANGVLFRDPPIDGLLRPNIADWHDLSPTERNAVRAHVRLKAGVDPRPAGRRRRRGGSGARPLPLGGGAGRLAARAGWLRDPRFVLGCGRELARRLSRRLRKSDP